MQPVWNLEHEIFIDPDSKIPFRDLYRLSPNELMETKEYLKDILKSRVTRPSISPSGGPSFLSSHQQNPPGES